MYCTQSMKSNKRKIAREDCERICLSFIFACVVGKNPKTPKLSPMTDNAITRGGIGGLESLVYICGDNPKSCILLCNGVISQWA